MREATPDFNISCVITDDDPALVNSMTEGFDSDFRHILCKWHILKNWKENLRHKVPKEFVPTMLEELKEIMNAVELDKFDHLFKGFFKKYEDNCRTSSFMKYFHQHYMPRCTKWAMCHRNFPHASVNTTGHIESFHSRLKRFYLKRKVNKRLDDLIDILLKLECDDHSTRAREASKGFSLLPDNILKRHKMLKSIKDECINQIFEDTWEINMGSTKKYVVVRHNVTCEFDHCFCQCNTSPCHGLCSHVYHCSCPDTHPCIPDIIQMNKLFALQVPRFHV
uniref:MULE transposase domain-containing protein n=1 Tax=Cacopsylla melanoneura TaxID=428564 RepID=A0A8D8TQR4_9HEMI